MPSKTNNLRDKLEENQLDLSLMQFTEVPVKEIVSAIYILLSQILILCLYYKNHVPSNEASFLWVSVVKSKVKRFCNEFDF